LFYLVSNDTELF